MKTLLAVLTFAMTTVALAPRSVTAQEAGCTNNYTKCMNDSWESTGLIQVMADIECFGDYVTCIRKKVTYI